MEIIPLLIFGYIAFQIFKGFTKTSSSGSGGSAKQMMQRLNDQIQEANKTQKPTSLQQRYQNQSPTQRGRESFGRKGQGSSPWGENGTAAPGARVATNYLKVKTKATRIASHKSPVQHGRRGKNMDQNRHRTDGWGQRGDSGILNTKTLVIVFIIGGGLLFALSNMPAL